MSVRFVSKSLQLSLEITASSTMWPQSTVVDMLRCAQAMAEVLADGGGDDRRDAWSAVMLAEVRMAAVRKAAEEALREKDAQYLKKIVTCHIWLELRVHCSLFFLPHDVLTCQSIFAFNLSLLNEEECSRLKFFSSKNVTVQLFKKPLLLCSESPQISANFSRAKREH